MAKKGPTPRKTRIKLAVIPEPAPDTRTVLAPDPEVFPKTAPVLQGDSNPNLRMVCGACGRTLVQGLKVGQFENIVFKCPDCGHSTRQSKADSQH